MKEEKFTKFQETQAKEHALYSEVIPRPVLVGELGQFNQYKLVRVAEWAMVSIEVANAAIISIHDLLVFFILPR